MGDGRGVWGGQRTVVGFHSILEDPAVTPELTFFWIWTRASKPVVLKVWPPDQQQEQQVGMRSLRPHPRPSEIRGCRTGRVTRLGF